MAYQEYISRKVVRETEKAYLVEVEVNNRRDGWKTKFRWVGKSICKPSNIQGEVNVPTYAISNGVW